MSTQAAITLALLSLILFTSARAGSTKEGGYAAKRLEMVAHIREEAKSIPLGGGKRPFTESVLQAMADVPRHLFVPAQVVSKAYEDRPLPIGYGQTISQPYIVALMTDLLDLSREKVVLEVGTGSGYQAAILAELAKRVYSIEIIDELGRKAKQRLKKLRYSNVTVLVGDGYYGLREHAPYDAIVVTAAASHIPPPLIRQLKRGGKMVIPVGSPFLTQQLMLVEKRKGGGITTRQLLPVRFVPLTGGHP